MPTDQPTDAGKDRELKDRELLDFANRLHGHAVSLRDEFDPNIISGDLDKAAREIRRLVRGREAARREGQAQERERHQRLVDAVGAFLASRHWEGTHTSDMGTAELWRAIDDLRAREPREEPGR
jgi:hypothetical protein